MDASTAVLTDAAKLLHQDLYAHLDCVEYLAEEDEWSDDQVDLVREVICELSTVVRHVIAGHKVSDAGMCLGCERAWPCQVVVTTHYLVKHPEHHFVRLVRAAMP